MLDAIGNRRSIRFYTDEVVSDEDVAEVLKAGFCAPSGHNRAPWHAVVIRDRKSKNALSTIHKWSKVVARAPVVIAVCVERGDFDHFWIEDGAAFVENMLIQAADMGLGTCWIGIRGLSMEGRDIDAETFVCGVLGLPDHLGVEALVLLGHPKRVPDYRQPAIPEGRVHYESFGGSRA